MAPPPIGMAIKRARERLRMTQAELGAELRVSQKTIDNWEHDRRYPKSSIGALEEVLGISLDTAAGPQIVSPRLRRLIREMQDLDDEDRRRVIGVLEKTLVIEPDEDVPSAQEPTAG